MANQGTHRRKAKGNRLFLETIDQRQHPEWFVTVAFYCALQSVEMLFAQSNHHSHGHSSRHGVLKKSWPNLWRNYRPLFDMSLTARYGTARIKPVHVQNAGRYLERLESLIKEAGSSPQAV